MLSNKAAAISIIIGVLVGIELNRTYVSENFERPLRFKILSNTFKVMSATARIGSSIGLGNEAILVRNMVDFFTGLIRYTDERVVIEDKLVGGIKIRVYRPKSVETGERLPIMMFYHGGGYAFGSVDNPYPIPTDDCFTATRYVIEHPDEFSADLNRFVVAGDSAGGDATAVVTMRLKKENLHMPKIQLLLYPWLQKVYTKFPSMVRYGHTGVIGPAKLTLSKFGSWYLGITNITDDLMKIYREGEIFGLITDKNQQKFILDCLDVNRIPEKYKPDKSYYETQGRSDISFLTPETSLLKKDPKLAQTINQLFKPELSPLFAPKNELVGLPKTYLLVLEWDSLKDEALIYADRLKEAGVDVHVAFYEDAFHGIVFMTQESIGYQIARDMQKDLIHYLIENL